MEVVVASNTGGGNARNVPPQVPLKHGTHGLPVCGTGWNWIARNTSPVPRDSDTYLSKEFWLMASNVKREIDG